MEWVDDETPEQRVQREADEKADAEYRVSQLTANEHKLVMKLAENDHVLEIEGEKAYGKTWENLENKGWTRSSTNGWTGSDCYTKVQFTLEGWVALCVLIDQQESKGV